MLTDSSLHRRASAALKLTNYPDGEVIKALYELILDDAAATITSTDSTGRQTDARVFLARQAAYEALRAMGESPERPDGYVEGLSRAFFH